MEEFSRMDLFVAATESGSFSAVARQRNLQPSSVSRQISTLEDDLGVRLLDRTTRHLGLTEAGELYFEFATRILNDARDAREAVAQLGGSPSGVLKIAAATGLAPQFLTPYLPAFLARYPKIELRVSLSDTVVDFVAEGFDMAIRMGHLKDSALVARRIATSSSVVCASPGYFAQAGLPSHPRELTEHQCLSFLVRPGPIVWRFDSPEGPLDITVTGRLRVDTGFVLLDAALAGLGIVMLPRWQVAQALAEGRLKTILEDFPQIPGSTPVHAIFPHRRFLAPKVKAMVEFLVERLSNLPLQEQHDE